MECQGLVTKVDPHYGYFEVDKKFIIHMSFLKAFREKTNLPQLQCKVHVKDLYRSSNTFVACIETILKGDFNVNYTPNFLTELIKNNKLSPIDVIFIHKTLNTLEKNFKFESSELKELVTKSLFEKLIETQGKKPQRGICNSIISHIDIETINEYKSIETHTKKFEEYQKWFFGIRLKQKKTSILFGFLYIDVTYGLLMINDHLHTMKVFVTNKESNADFTESCYVLFEDYKIITEIYSSSDVPNFEYLLVDIKDIIIVHSLERKKCLFGKNPPEQNFDFTEEIVLYKKSTIRLSADNKTETYLEVGSNSGKKTFLTLCSTYTEIILHLKVGYRYKIYHNFPLKYENNRNLASAGKFNQFRLTETGAYFQELGNAGVPDINNILPISDYKKYKNSGSVSFEAVVDSRWFVENKCPEFPNNNKLYGFSTPGSEVHVLSFLGGSKMYLSSWINRLMPYGLISQMRLIINNVIPKDTFLQTTVFTYFDIIGYEPKVPFQSVNLYLNHEYDWGPSYYLSRGNNIPSGVILWTPVHSLSITDVKMTNRCKMCRVVIEAAGPCRDCGSQERDMKFNLIMYSMDIYGKSRILVNDVNVLKLVLDMQDRLFAIWLKDFGNTGEFRFNSFDSDSSQLEHIESNSNLLSNALKHLIRTFNKCLDDKFEIKCRKFYDKDKSKTVSQYPVWFYIDGRKSTGY